SGARSPVRAAWPTCREAARMPAARRSPSRSCAHASPCRERSVASPPPAAARTARLKPWPDRPGNHATRGPWGRGCPGRPPGCCRPGTCRRRRARAPATPRRPRRPRRRRTATREGWSHAWDYDNAFWPMVPLGLSMEAAPIARRNAAIAPFHVMEVQTAARALEAQGVDVVHMEIGEPDFPAPAPVLAAARAALDDGAIFYTSALGLPALREAIAGHYRDHYGVAVDPARIVVTAGSSAALLLVLGLIVDRDSALLMADPHYPCNRNIVATLEGVAQTVPVDAATRYQLTAALVDRHWQPSTRGVLVATPSNPTGTTIDHDELARIAAVVARRGGHLVVDEIYLGLTYGAPARSALDVANDAFIISSFSKHFNMTGWRLGWIVAPERVRGATRLSRRRTARDRLRRPGDAGRRLLRLRRLLALLAGFGGFLPRRARAYRRRDHAGHRLRKAPRALARALRVHGRPGEDRSRRRAPARLAARAARCRPCVAECAARSRSRSKCIAGRAVHALPAY